MFDLYILLCLEVFCWIDLIICQVFNLAQDFLNIDWMALEGVLYIWIVDKGRKGWWKVKASKSNFFNFLQKQIFSPNLKNIDDFKHTNKGLNLALIFLSCW